MNNYKKYNDYVDALIEGEDFDEVPTIGIPFDMMNKQGQGEYWTGIPDDKEVILHISVTGEKPKSMLITDRVSTAKEWVLRDSLPSQKEVDRWSKVFQRTHPDEEYPYLQFKVDSKTKNRGITVPVTRNFLSNENTYVTTYQDYRTGINKLRFTLQKGIWEIVFKRLDGTTRLMRTSDDHEWLHNYYANHNSGMYSDDYDPSQREMDIKEDRELLTGMLKLPDIEAPISQGVIRSVNTQAILSIKKINEEDVDSTYVNFDVAALQNVLATIPAVTVDEIIENKPNASVESLPSPTEGVLVSEYVRRVLDSHSTQALREFCVLLDGYRGLSMYDWLGGVSAESLF